MLGSVLLRRPLSRYFYILTSLGNGEDRCASVQYRRSQPAPIDTKLSTGVDITGDDEVVLLSFLSSRPDFHVLYFNQIIGFTAASS